MRSPINPLQEHVCVAKGNEDGRTPLPIVMELSTPTSLGLPQTHNMRDLGTKCGDLDQLTQQILEKLKVSLFLV